MFRTAILLPRGAAMTLRGNAWMMRVLRTVRDAGIPDAWVGAWPGVPWEAKNQAAVHTWYTRKERWPGVRVVKDWVRWHDDYADPLSSLSRRRAVVQAALRKALDEHAGVIRLVSMCAGDGGDVLPVLREHPASVRTRPLLIELDPALAARAGEHAVVADAGVTDSYLAHGRAHILLACGVFGNISADDARRTIATLKGLVEPGATVIWTRAHDGPSREIRGMFAAQGFAEVSFVAPADAPFRVGVSRATTTGPRPAAGVRLFRFR